jgi:hypothetical protein
MAEVFNFPTNRARPMTVGDLRRVVANKELPNEMPVYLEIMCEAAGDSGDEDLLQVELLSAQAEERCDEIEALYCFGSTIVQ